MGLHTEFRKEKARNAVCLWASFAHTLPSLFLFVVAAKTGRVFCPVTIRGVEMLSQRWMDYLLEVAILFIVVDAVQRRTSKNYLCTQMWLALAQTDKGKEKKEMLQSPLCLPRLVALKKLLRQNWSHPSTQSTRGD